MKELRLNRENFVFQSGRMWACALTLAANEGDTLDFPAFSSWRLFENGVELGPAHSPHHDIQSMGGGAYSHWSNALYFSASDGSDPTTNGREYILAQKGKAFPFSGIIKTLSLMLFRRGSALLIIFAMIGLFFTRASVFVCALLSGYFLRENETEDFREFYQTFVKMFDVEKNGCLFTQVFMKYVEREFYKKAELIDPSLEMAVYNGVVSKLFFNYPFSKGTELYFDTFKKYAGGLPHSSFEQFNILEYKNSLAEAYNTVVFVHSVDDFTSSDTSILFDAFYHLLKKGGAVYFSGYTDYMKETYVPYKIIKALKPGISFHDFRQMHESNLLSNATVESLCSGAGLTVETFKEFNNDPLFTYINAVEDYLSRLFYVSEARRFLWRLEILRKAHIGFNVALGGYLLLREKKYSADPHRRGVNFYCKAVKP